MAQVIGIKKVLRVHRLRIKKNSEKQIHVGKKHTKKEYPTNCIEDILFGFFSLFI